MARDLLILALALACTLAWYSVGVAVLCPCEWQTYYPPIGRIP